MKYGDLRLRMERGVLDYPAPRWVASMGLLAVLWAIAKRYIDGKYASGE